MTEFYSYSMVPPVCGKQSLDDINKWVCTLYIPSVSSKAYKEAPQWEDFFKYEEMDVPMPAEIRLDKYYAEIEETRTLQLTATVLPVEAGNTYVAWTSSDESVATVSANGVVTGVSVGTVTITAMAGEVSASCEVKVIEKSGVEGVSVEGDTTVVVYNIHGIRMDITTMDELKTLTPGFYIINGKKMLIK